MLKNGYEGIMVSACMLVVSFAIILVVKLFIG